MTATKLAYQCANSPPVDDLEPYTGHCATCGDQITQGVPQSKINNPTFSQHGDFLKGSHVCSACVFLYRAGKAKPGNFAAIEGMPLAYLSIADTGDKQSWQDLLHQIKDLPPSTLCTGVLTTDVKPRLWPRMRKASIGAFGLYVHASDYDVSQWIEFDLSDCLSAIKLIQQAMALGYSKTFIYTSLYADHKTTTKHLEKVLGLESALSAIRQQSHFLPALLIARKESTDVTSASTAAKPAATTTSGNQPDQAQLGLL